jgi:hypothetical protein
MIQKKVCMVGTSGVGKTSLVAKFVHSMFSDKYLTTVGVKIDKKTVAVVRYEAVNAMLLNEFLKEHRNVAEQQTKVAEQESTIADQGDCGQAARRLRIQNRPAAEANRSSYCDCTKSERPSRSRQTFTTVSRQPLK